MRQISFLKLSNSERALYFRQVAASQGLHPAIIEKDFWVCWILALLFDRAELKSHLVFKGGTSLSKVFRVIERFSEDIDLSISPAFLGLSEAQIEEATSRTQRDRWMQTLEQTCGLMVHDRIRPILESSISYALGPCISPEAWIVPETDYISHSPILLFNYPSVAEEGFAYLRRTVKLEFGSLTDQRPVGEHIITPWVAEHLPNAFRDWTCRVIALDIERSFWEKATILHSEAFRIPDDPMPSRYSRHYADMAALAQNPTAMTAIGMNELRDRVVRWKSRFFARSWARYDLAVCGTFRLVPSQDRIRALESDYKAMEPMFITKPIPFDRVLHILGDLELRINNQSCIR